MQGIDRPFLSRINHYLGKYSLQPFPKQNMKNNTSKTGQVLLTG